MRPCLCDRTTLVLKGSWSSFQVNCTTDLPTSEAAKDSSSFSKAEMEGGNFFLISKTANDGLS